MKIKINELEQKIKEGYSFSFQIPLEIINPVINNCVILKAPLVNGIIKNTGNKYQITGEVTYEKEYTCDCCLTKVKKKETIPFSEEISFDDDLIKDEFLDLMEYVRDVIVIAQPIRNLCQEDCKGLCPKCGADLNKGDCNCNREIIDERLAILKNFSVTKKD